MTETELWILGGFASAIVIVGSALIHHMLHCKGNTESINDIKEDITTNIRPEIKTLRDRAHESSNGLLRLDGRVSVLEERTK